MDGPKPETDKDRRICSICKQKPTISDSSTYCASCMGKRGNEKLRQRAIKAPKQEKDKRMKEDPTNAGKVDCRANMEVVVDFAKYPDLLKQPQEVSDDQILFHFTSGLNLLSKLNR